MTSPFGGGPGGWSGRTDPRVIQDVRERKQKVRDERDKSRFDEYLTEGTNSLADVLKSTTSAAMPELDQRLQESREGHIRRGVNLGDIGTRDEGSILSAFQRNLANAAGAQSLGVYGMARELQSADRDREMMEKNAAQARRSGIWGTLGTIGGAALGNPAIGGAVAKWFTGGK